MEASPSPVYGARLLSGFGLIPIASSNLAASANTRAPQPWLGGPSRRRRPWARLGYRPWTLKAAQQSNSAADAGRPCLLYTSDAADAEDSVDLGGRGII